MCTTLKIQYTGKTFSVEQIRWVCRDKDSFAFFSIKSYVVGTH